MIKMKDLIQEDRNIQEVFKKNVLNENIAIITTSTPKDVIAQSYGKMIQRVLKEKGIKSTLYVQSMKDIELTVDAKDGKKALDILSDRGVEATLNVVVRKNIQSTGASSSNDSSVIVTALTPKDMIPQSFGKWLHQFLKKKGIPSQLMKYNFDNKHSFKVAKSDAKDMIDILSAKGIEIDS